MSIIRAILGPSAGEQIEALRLKLGIVDRRGEGKPNAAPQVPATVGEGPDRLNPPAVAAPDEGGER